MPQPTQHLISLEVRTLQPLDPNDPEPQYFPTITVFQDEENNYFLASGINEIKTTILNSVPHLYSDHLYPLFFSIQILPGTELEAYLYSARHDSPTRNFQS